MFHANKGAIGIRIEFVADVLLESVQVLDVDNTANAGHWLCGEKFRLPATDELVEPRQLDSGGDRGADVRGITLSKVDGVVFKGVRVEQLTSLEGAVQGIELHGDTNDRRDNTLTFTHELTLDRVHIGTMIAGAGHAATPVSADLATVYFGESCGMGKDVAGVSEAGDGGSGGMLAAGLSVDANTLAHNQLDAPRVTLRHAISNLTVPTSQGNYIEMSFNPAFGTVRAFLQKFTLELAIGSHSCSLRRVTNGIPLGWPLSYRFTL
jgi:hypothetical protein